MTISWARRRRTSRSRDSTGSITPFVLIVGVAVLALAGLVIDGGRQLNAKGRAVAYAQEAARAGAQGVDVTDVNLDLAPDTAISIARGYCRQAMAADSQLTSCDPAVAHHAGANGGYNSVSVTASVRVNTILMAMFGGPAHLTSSGSAQARPISGLSRPDQGQLPTSGPPSYELPGKGGISSAPPGSAEPPPAEEVPSCETPSPGRDNGDKDGNGDKGKDGDGGKNAKNQGDNGGNDNGQAGSHDSC